MDHACHHMETIWQEKTSGETSQAVERRPRQILERHDLAEGSARQANLETSCWGLRPTTGHYGCSMMIVVLRTLLPLEPTLPWCSEACLEFTAVCRCPIGTDPRCPIGTDPTCLHNHCALIFRTSAYCKGRHDTRKCSSSATLCLLLKVSQHCRQNKLATDRVVATGEWLTWVGVHKMPLQWLPLWRPHYQCQRPSTGLCLDQIRRIAMNPVTLFQCNSKQN